MTNDQKIIKNKIGLLRLAQELDNVSKACEVIGYSEIASIGSRNCMTKKGKPACKKSVARNPC